MNLYKLENNTLLIPTDTAIINGHRFGGMLSKPEYWISQGYKPMTGEPMPQDGKAYKPIYTDTPEAIIRTWEELPPVPEDPRVLGLRDKYRQATHGICQLAGVPIVDKLEDSEYEQVALAAAQADFATANMLTQTIMYALFQLYRLDGDDAWERI
jgi:hypothetical protein